jgi:hypothetical protein
LDELYDAGAYLLQHADLPVDDVQLLTVPGLSAAAERSSTRVLIEAG